MRRAHYNYLLALGLLSLVGCQPYDGGSSSAGLFGASANMLVAVPSVSGTFTTTVGASSTLSVSFLTDQTNPIISLSISGLSALPSGWSASGASTCTLAFRSSGCNLRLTYAPSAVTRGTLTLSYRYSSKFGGIHSDSLTIPYAATTDNNVVASAAPSGAVNAVLGSGSQSVAVTFTTDDGNAATALALTSDLSSLPSGWTSSGASFSCASLASGNGCQLPLTYAPSSVGSGILTLNYSYIDNAGQSKTGALNIPYASTSSNNVVGTASPSGQIAVSAGGNQSVAVTFTTDDGNAATALALTSDLSSLPSGWTSSAPSFSCASVSTGNGCQLALTYAPSAVASGTLSLAYTYTDNAGEAKSGYVNIPYIGTTHDHVIGTASPSGQLSVSVNASQAVSVTFTTDDGNAATNLSVTSDLSSLPSGWTSGAGSFSCASVSTGSGCQLSLTYAPPAAATGTLNLNYSYTNNAGTVMSGTVNIPYVASASIGGAVSGLSGTLVLQDNGGDNLSLSSNGSFTFATPLEAGAPYSVSVLSQPTGETCTVASGSGTVTGTVASVAISCSTNTYSIGGSISGLTAAGLTLTDNGGNTTPIASGSTSFTFSSQIAYGNTYSVAVSAQPTGQSCTVASGSGTVSGTVSNVSISCVNVYTIGGTISGLTMSSVVLATGSQTVTVSHAASSWVFPTAVVSGTAYAVTVQTQPVGEVCEVTAGASGTVSGANVSNVTVVCGFALWTWEGGSSGENVTGVYGTKGTPSASNVPGGRQAVANWTDSSGNLWLFGGNGYGSTGSAGWLNDLWEYSPSSGEWTWMSGSSTTGATGYYGTKGTPSSSTVPGARARLSSWIDSSGNLWLFGGNNGSVSFNDLWEYSPASGEWTWVSGSSSANASGVYGTKGTASSSNVPGARDLSVSWIDSAGHLWLFGGSGYDSAGNSGNLNDLWEYSPSSGQWTWVSGSNVRNADGVYGTQGAPAAGNVPGARSGAARWIDSSGNLWLFGGAGYDATGGLGNLNDLWEYSPSSGEWTWVSGGSGDDTYGVYGTQGTAAASNMPGSRWNSATWVDPSGNLWLFGGPGYGATSNGWLNDLWEYSPSSGEWTWIGGSSTLNAAGVYGMQGTAASGNVPGADQSPASWVDASGHVWLFGGSGEDAADAQGYLNSLWQASVP